LPIRSNFSYSRTVSDELSLFDRSKPLHLRDKVLMLRARDVVPQVNLKRYDFDTRRPGYNEAQPQGSVVHRRCAVAQLKLPA